MPVRTLRNARPLSSRLSVTSRWRCANASAKRKAIRLRKHDSEPGRPVSFETEVMRTPSIPQGTTYSNGWRSLSTLIAKPCVVTPRDTCTPIDPILRSPAQTPVSPSRTSASIPSSASAATMARSIVFT